MAARLRGAGLLLLGLGARPLAAQGVVVAPHAVHIDDRARSASVELYNPGNTPVEVTISTVFGFPATDSAGTVTLRTIAAPDSTWPSAADWIQAFPRRTTVAPQARQTVRLLARPPADLPDGESWTRLVVAAKGGQVDVAGVSDTSALQVGLTLEIRTIIAVTYRKGEVQTGVSVMGVHTAVEGDSLAVQPVLSRQGNGAFIGTLSLALLDSAGAERRRGEFPLAVYYDLSPVRRLDIDGLPAGPYRLLIELNTERHDVPDTVVLQAPPVRDTLEVTLP